MDNQQEKLYTEWKTLEDSLKWWFSIIDIIEALTGTDRPRKYWNDLKKKLIKEGYFEVSEKIGQLKLMANDGKYYETDCADTETVFRIIQTIPSPNAEPFKRWLTLNQPSKELGRFTKPKDILTPENKKRLR